MLRNLTAMFEPAEEVVEYRREQAKQKIICENNNTASTKKTKIAPVPRHREIKKGLVKKIC